MVVDSKSNNYIHGFSKVEQQRLLDQARIHEDIIFGSMDFSGRQSLLEVGCGVGAQTQILSERYPDLKMTSIDTSAEQIESARQNLKPLIDSHRVNLKQVEAGKSLPFESEQFDSAFICWVLEHVPEPVSLLKEVHGTLKADAVLYCNEVLNSTFYVNPYSPNTLKYWFEFNDFQWSLGGDPFIGGRLANYLIQAGYQEVQTKVLTHQYDNRTPKKRAQFIDYWCELLLSGAPKLIEAGRVDEKVVEGMKAELNALKKDPDSVIFYSWILASAVAL